MVGFWARATLPADALWPSMVQRRGSVPRRLGAIGLGLGAISRCFPPPAAPGLAARKTDPAPGARMLRWGASLETPALGFESPSSVLRVGVPASIPPPRRRKYKWLWGKVRGGVAAWRLFRRGPGMAVVEMGPRSCPRFCPLSSSSSHLCRPCPSFRFLLSKNIAHCWQWGWERWPPMALNR